MGPAPGGGEGSAPSPLEHQLAWQLHVLGLPAPAREWRFAPPRRWRLDFAWPERRVAVEIDGGTWSGGRHVRGAGVEADCEKLSEAAARGWRVLRVSARMVRDGRAAELARRALTAAPPEKGGPGDA